MKRFINKIKRKKDLTVDEAIKLHIDPHAEDKFEFFSRKVLVLSLIIFSVLALVAIGVYTGYVTYHEGQGGKIYELDLQFKRPAFYWAGIYGASFGVGLTQPWEFNISPGTMNEENVFFDCFETGIPHEIYASTVPLNQLDTGSLQAATLQDIEAFMGTDSALEAAANTLTELITFAFGTVQINNVLSTYTNVGAGSATNSFDTGILKDDNGNIVVVGHVFENLTNGFNDRYYNYQMLLPMRLNQSTQYYLFSDPNDICIGGSETPKQKGTVNGTVTDTTGNLIEDVIIVIGTASTVTDVNGYYTTLTEIGNQTIFAIKEGYKVYTNTVNVVLNNVTEHNIVLEIDTIPNTNTNVGPSFDEGVDDEGTGIGPGEVPVQIQNPDVIEGEDFIVALNEIYKRMREGEFAQETVYVLSYKTGTTEVNVDIYGDIANFTEIDKSKLLIPSKQDDEFTLTFFASWPPGIYNGTINLTGGIEASIPVTIEILDRNMLPVQALLIDLSAPTKTIYSGSTFTLRTDLTNLLTDRQYPVKLLYTIQSIDGDQTLWTHSTNVFVKTSTSLINNVEIPPDAKIGDYVVRVTADYLDFTSSASYVFVITLPFYQYVLFGGIRVWHVILFLILLALIYFTYKYIKKNLESKKKYHLKFELSEMPKPGPRSILVGKIAETQHKSYMNIEAFKTHAIVAGSTGGGKSFSAQVIIEEMLLKDIAVIVFDPTAQWSGMLRKLTNKGLLALYPNYGLKPNDAKAFKGNIRQINNARELIDIRKYMIPGEIQVFACHKLDPKDLDIFVANTVRQVFHENFDESEPLRLVLVYDEVHRLLPKFGGSGEGFLQIERACREFRKWGVGVMLISQVLADFVGQIKANINTEVQMRTRDEGDLDRIKTKYGGDVLQSLVKASVGTGMCQNAQYNRGRPYFTTFRPIMHSVARLTDEEIEKFNEYNDKIDQVNYELEQLEELKQDVFDLKLETKLALDKIKAGNFNMGQIYLEGVTPRIQKFWDKLGKKPKKLEIKMVSEADMKAELEKAKADHDKAKAASAKTGGAEAGGEAKKDDPVSRFKADVDPEHILHLHNDMLVVNAKTLGTEIDAMKDSDFEFHVSENKNDFADWIRDAIGDKELADLIGQETDKKAIVDLLNKREKGEKLPKFEKKIEAKEEPADPKDQKKAVDEMSKPSEENKEEKKEEPPKEEPKKEEVKEEVKEPSKEEPKKEEIKEPPKVEVKEEEKKEEPHKEEVKEEPKKEEVKEEPKEEPKKEEAKEENTSNQKEAFDELSKDPNSTDSPAKDYSKETSSDKYFRLENGTELKSIKELKDYLPSMPDELFNNHVQNDKNDFANWIRNVFNEDDLANKMMQVKSKGGIEEVLSSV